MRTPRRSKTKIEDAIAEAARCLRERGDGKLSRLCETKLIQALSPTVYVVHRHEKSEGSTIRGVVLSVDSAMRIAEETRRNENFRSSDEVEFEEREIEP